ncbi:MAG: hypothetical protein JW797_15940 [Bradymonadales bacterium]|nr:hypothetical protein [Bradymonadales bacterium]
METDLKITLTGPPRCGKTTVLKKACALLKERGVHLRGFLTEEIGDAGRSGFLLVTFDGIRVPFAHVDLKRGPRVGPYKVDLPAFEAAVLPQLRTGRKRSRGGKSELLVVDEIGRMECLSAPFVEEMDQLLSMPVCLLMTVGLRGGGLMERVRNLAGDNLIQVTESNREMLPAIILESVTSRCVEEP